MHDHRIRCVSIFLIAICIGSGLHAADVVTVAGNGQNDYSGDGGLATQAAVAQPFGIVVGPDNALYIC